MNFIRCECYDCTYNCNGECGKEVVTISYKDSNEFFHGQRITYPVCEDYKEIVEDGTD